MDRSITSWQGGDRVALNFSKESLPPLTFSKEKGYVVAVCNSYTINNFSGCYNI